jgi:hypothetical protein
MQPWHTQAPTAPVVILTVKRNTSKRRRKKGLERKEPSLQTALIIDRYLLHKGNRTILEQGSHPDVTISQCESEK